MTHKTPAAFEHELRDAIARAQPDAAFVDALEARLTAQIAPRPTLWSRIQARLAPRAGQGSWEATDNEDYYALEADHGDRTHTKPARYSARKLVTAFAVLALVIGTGAVLTGLATPRVTGRQGGFGLGYALNDRLAARRDIGGNLNGQAATLDSPLASPFNPQGSPTPFGIDPRSLNDCRQLPEPLAALGRNAPSPVAIALPESRTILFRSNRVFLRSLEGMPLISPVDGTVWITRTDMGDIGSHYNVAIVGTATDGSQALPWSFVLTWSHGSLAVRNEQPIRAGDLIGYLGHQQQLQIDFAYISPTGPKIPDVLCVFPALRGLNNWSWLMIEDNESWESVVQRSGMDAKHFFTLNPFLDRQPPQPGTFVRTQLDSGQTGSSESTFIWPLDGIVTRSFSADHLALQIEGSPGEQVVAAADGVVSAVEAATQTKGVVVTIEHANETRTRYVSLATSAVTVGAQVVRGQSIGTIGGEQARLRFEMTRRAQPIDPTRRFAPRSPEVKGLPQNRYFVQVQPHAGQPAINAFLTSAERYKNGVLVLSSRFVNQTGQSAMLPGAPVALLDTGVSVLESTPIDGLPATSVLLEPRAALINPTRLHWRFDVGGATGPFTLTVLSQQFLLVPMELPFDFETVNSESSANAVNANPADNSSWVANVFMLTNGETARAIMDGTVVAVEPDSTGEFFDIRIQHDFGYASSYKRFGKALVAVGEPVLQGQAVAIAVGTPANPFVETYFTLTKGEAQPNPTPSPSP
jgi:murein DD-endopeptidase MepM/ murein hydrolase activator NlpD